MDMENDITHTRVELKYIVPAAQVEEIVARMPALESRSYGVATVYYDRPDGGLTRTAVENPTRCTKVRTREYLDGSPYVWFEVKTRAGAWTRKARFKVEKAAVGFILDGGDASKAPLACACPECLRQVGEARRCLGEISIGRFVPVGVVCARRRTFGNADTALRFTLDRDIGYFRAPGRLYDGGIALSPEALGPALWSERDSVLELKHGGRAPLWCGSVLRGLQPSAYSKFRTLARFVKTTLSVPDHVD